MSSESQDRHALMLARRNSALLLVDIQEKLLPAIAGGEAVASRCRLLAEVAVKLQIPIIGTEQYPKGLGRTVASLAPFMPFPVEKQTFSCCGAHTVLDQLDHTKASQILVCGIESHVCVAQTAFDLLWHGYRVFVPADAVGSRRAEDKERALARMAQDGIHITTAEAAVFEWLRTAAAPEFKEISQLIKASDAER